MAHFGPGVYDRLGIGGAQRAALDLLGRLATPAFVLIFGVTLAIIYIPKAQRSPAATARSLINRAALVFGCSLIVGLRGTVEALTADDQSNLWFRLLTAQYSVLTFYTVAILATALAIRFIASDPARLGLLGGASLIFVGSVLGYAAFPSQGVSAIEVVGLVFVSGKYGVLVLMGSAWLMIGVGVLVQRHLANGTSFHRDVMVIAVGMALLGLSDGRIVGWRTVADLSSGYATPPQFWYLAMVGGATLSSLVVLDRYSFPVVGFVLERIGRYPLSIYVSHSLVLPAARLLRWIAPSIPETLGTILFLTLFVMFCVSKIWKSTAPERAWHPVRLTPKTAF